MLTRSRSRSHSSEETLEEGNSQLSNSQSDSAPQEEPARKKKKQTQARGRGFKRNPDQWVRVVPEAFQTSQENGTNISIVTLKHPGSNCSSKFLLKEVASGSECCEICEILKFSDDPRSWFIGNTVHTDGSLHLCTPLDPLFLALPYFQLAAKSGKFTTLDVILEDDEFDSFGIISKCVSPAQWANICSEKSIGCDNTMVYRYSKEKTLAWLKKKVTVLADTVEEEGVYVGRGSQSSMLVKSSQAAEVTKGDYLTFACGIVRDYLNKDLGQELSCLYPSSSAATESSSEGTGKAKGAVINGDGAVSNGDGGEGMQPPAKRRHLEKSEPLEDYSQCAVKMVETAQALKQTAAQKNLAKIDKTGMKSLSSFFKKKSTKPNT